MKKEPLTELLNEIYFGSGDSQNSGNNNVDFTGLTEIGKQLIEETKLKFLTVLSKEEASKFALLFALNEELDISMLDTFLTNSMMLRISVDGRGRKDLTELTKNMALPFLMLSGLGGNAEMFNTDSGGIVQKGKKKLGI